MYNHSGLELFVSSRNLEMRFMRFIHAFGVCDMRQDCKLEKDWAGNVLCGHVIIKA